MATVNPATLGDAAGQLTTDRDLAAYRQSRSHWVNSWRQFRRHRMAMAGLVVLVLITAACFIGGHVYSSSIYDLDFNVDYSSPTFDYPMGTDPLGRDILARVLWGGRVSLLIGFCSGALAVLVGTLVGAASGFFGGAVDNLLMRITDLFICLPQLPLLLLVSYLYRDAFYDYFDEKFDDGNKGVFVLLVLVISALSWMSIARLVRASFLSLKQVDFVLAARSIGASRNALVFRHMLPNALGPIIVAATLTVSGAIIFEAALAYLGLGFTSDVPSWGRLLYDARDEVQFYPHMAIFPGLMIFLTVLSINFIGDGLRDALDPRKTR